MIYGSRSPSTLSVEFTAEDRIPDRDLRGRFYEGGRWTERENAGALITRIAQFVGNIRPQRIASERDSALGVQNLVSKRYAGVGRIK